MPNPNDLKVEGELIRFSYQADSGSFAIAKVMATEEITATGPLGHITPGQHVRMFGEWKNHQSFGWQFTVERVLIDNPRTLRGIELYLSSGDIKGLGPTFANRVVQHFGMDTLEIVQKTPERLLEVKGIGKKRLSQVTAHLKRKAEYQEIIVTMRSFGLAEGLTNRIIKRYGEDTLGIIKKNPYQLAKEIRGIGFKKADEIALTQGILEDSPIRAEAGILHILREGEAQGHCYLPYSTILNRIKLLQLPIQTVIKVLDDMTKDGRLYDGTTVETDKALSRPQVGYVELRTAEKLLKLNRAKAEKTLHSLVPLDIKVIEKDLELNLNPTQRAAILGALEHQIVVITGGPGTGKTTIVKVLMAAAKCRGENWFLAAPTGRAAKRLSEATGLEAKTVHRLLSYSGHTRKFLHNSDNTLPCKAVVIDEASMLDIWLFDSLVQALKMGTKLILVGDVDQLPSVGPGQVLGDIISSNVLPICRLKEVYRQAQNSNIVRNAHRVNQGLRPISCERDPEASPNKDFFFIPRDDAFEAQRTLLEVVSQRLPKLGFNPLKDVQVLTPMHNGPLGTQALNHLLQDRLNPNPTKDNEGKRFRKNDRVLQVRNDYDNDIFNGDIGKVLETNEDGICVNFDSKKVHLKGNQITELELAYAVSIHKSQGSEYPAVVIVMHSAHRIMLRRNLLYTGITRARSFVCLIGSNWAIETAVAETGGNKRWTKLSEHLGTLS